MRILVVEDEDKTRLELVSSLENEGYSVDSSDNGSSALRLISKNRYDFVLSDLNLPHVDGLELAEKLNGEPPMILYTSGNYVMGLKDLADHFKVKIFMTNATIPNLLEHAIKLFSKNVQDNTNIKNQLLTQ